jgi:bifunctional DNA-binding transcriptional regulator/antitoxin component of YhaV-PrlF toxin-antitoxin module
MAAKSEQFHDNRASMDEVSAAYRTKSDKIRALSNAGYRRADIARYLDIRYQHVRNVLVEDERLGGRKSDVQQDANDEAAIADDAPLDPILSRMGQDGLIAVPANFRQALGLKENDPVIMTVEEDSIRIMSLAESVRRAQAIVRKFIPEGISLVDELLSERRQDAAREGDDHG